MMESLLDRPLITLAMLAHFIEVHGYPEVVLVSKRDYAELLSLHRLVDNEVHTVYLLGTAWTRGTQELSILDWSNKELTDVR